MHFQNHNQVSFIADVAVLELFNISPQQYKPNRVMLEIQWTLSGHSTDSNQKHFSNKILL